jgi:hypothetical protein
MILIIELQYFPTIYSISCLINSTYIDLSVSDPWQRRSFRNRTIIAAANGLLALSIPVEGGRNQKALYRDVRIDYRGDWQVRHWRSIFSAYGKSPWFFQYADGVEHLFRHRDPFLVDWNFRCLEWLCSALRLTPAAPLTMACRHREGGSVNVRDGEGGRPYNAHPVTEEMTRLGTHGAGIPVRDLRDRVSPAHFQHPALGIFPRYSQVFEERWGFQPNLGILDLLFCCGPGAMAILKSTGCHTVD